MGSVERVLNDDIPEVLLLVEEAHLVGARLGRFCCDDHLSGDRIQVLAPRLGGDELGELGLGVQVGGEGRHLGSFVIGHRVRPDD